MTTTQKSRNAQQVETPKQGVSSSVKLQFAMATTAGIN